MLGPMDMLLFGGATVLMLFGTKKRPELMNGLGSGLKEFKKAQAELEEEIAKPVVKYPETDKPNTNA